MYNEAINILKKINDLGYEAYIVGGYPRDLYRGIINNDIDICSNINVQVLLENFNITYKTKFGNFIIDNKFELTLFRKEEYSNSRYPQIEYVNTLEEDLKRRDFIINTLCIDYNENYIDLMNAKKDIDNKVINVVGDINIKMKEDPLRIVRALRFSSDLNFNLNFNIKEYIISNKKLLKLISNKRIKKELDKVKNKQNFNKLLKELDLENYIK